MFLVLLACAEPVATCPDGFTGGDDGLCYPDDTAATGTDTTPTSAEPPTLEDIFDALPPCEAAATDGRIDVYAGCADGVCPGDSYDDVVATLGEEPDCYGFYYEIDGYVGGSLSCAWDSGIELDFDDLDQDGVADVGSTSSDVTLNESYDGGTEDGLGIGATMACFVDALGYPTNASFELVDKDWIPSYAYWEDAGLAARDYYGPRDSYDSDGFVDGLSLYGSTGGF